MAEGDEDQGDTKTTKDGEENRDEGQTVDDEDEEEETEGSEAEDDEDEPEEEPKLKYARLTSHLGPVYRNGDATSTFLVAGDKMVGICIILPAANC